MCLTTVFIIFFITVQCNKSFAIQMPKKVPPTSRATNNVGEDDHEQNTFTHCIRTRQASSVMACAGLAALNKLQHLQNQENFNVVDGVTFIQTDPAHMRGINILDQDPLDYRGIFESFSTALSQRTMLWDMSTIYPGLGLRLGPSYGGAGYLEFFLDPLRESIENVKESTSTARVLTRQLLIPFLLGFKFNIATLVPLLFGLLAILAKKAAFISKLAFIVSSAVGLGSLLLGNGNNGSDGYGSSNNGETTFYSTRYQHPFGQLHQHHHFKTDSEFVKSSPPDPTSAHVYTETLYHNVGNNDDADPVTLTGHIEDLYTNSNSRDEKKKKAGRNFSWSNPEIKAT